MSTEREAPPRGRWLVGGVGLCGGDVLWFGGHVGQVCLGRGSVQWSTTGPARHKGVTRRLKGGGTLALGRAGGTVAGVYPRALTVRESAVLDALLAIDFDGVAQFREQAGSAQVLGGCGCGCPSIDFVAGRGQGMRVLVNASCGSGSGPSGGLFLFAVETSAGEEVLGGIDWLSEGDDLPRKLPDPRSLTISAA